MQDEPTRGDVVALDLCATGDYFSALGIHLSAGRQFNDLGGSDTIAPAIVSDAFTRAYGLTPQAIIGRSLTSRGVHAGVVVGVVSDVRHMGPEQKSDLAVYVPCASSRWFLKTMHIVVRTRGQSSAYVPSLREALERTEQNIALYNVRTFADVRAKHILHRRFAQSLITPFAVLSLMISLVGLYGVINYQVTLRTRELAIRIAVGASPRQVSYHVFRRGIRYAAIGAVLGLAGGTVAWTVVTARVEGIGAIEPFTAAVIAVAVFSLAAAVSWIAARGARAIPVSLAIRAE
jgi:ABC-type lipoprotein release transport system permease subunit